MYSTAKQVRRAIAIILTILTVVCLFWPPMVYINTELLEVYGIDVNITDPAARKGSEHEHLIYNLVRAMGSIGFGENYARWINYSDVAEYDDRVQTAEVIYKVLSDDCGLTVSETLSAGSAFNKHYFKPFQTYFKNHGRKNIVAWYQAMITLAYIMFIVIILCAIGSIIMMLLKKPRVFAIILAVLAVIVSGCYAGIVIGHSRFGTEYNIFYQEVRSYPLFFVGPGIFLLPLFAIGAAVIYPSAKTGRSGAWVCLSCAAKNSGTKRFCKNCGAQRPNGNTGTGTWICPACRWNNQGINAFCSHCGAPKPVARPVPKPVSTPPENGWTCVNCGMVNTAQSRFCERCGRIKPAPEPKPQPAPVQEPKPQPAPAPEPASAYQFCPECGTKQEPGARFCLECGKKLI